MLVYLDSCCFSREFTDQGVPRNLHDASDLRVIRALIQSGRVRYACSHWLLRELRDAEPATLRRALFASLPVESDVWAPQTSRLFGRIRELSALRFCAKDSAHIASAEAAGADVMLTTDDELAELARQNAMMLKVKVRLLGPWLSETLNEKA